jgi:hypothetical protein
MSQKIVSLNWTQTDSAADRARAALQEVKMKEPAKRMVRVDKYYLCVPAELSQEQIDKRIEKHRKELERCRK